MCGGTPQHCVDECARLQFETRSREAEDPECDPAGTVFSETLEGLAPVDREALRFAGTSNVSAVRWLLAMGASVKARDKNGTTMLHAVCRSGSCLTAQELVKHGFPLDAADCAGWTPLHIAAVMGRRDVTQLLLRVRANIGAKNKRGATPLSLCSDPGTKEVLEEFSTNVTRPHPKPFLADMLVASIPGQNQDGCTTCEPFFVPRVPLFHDEAHRAELVKAGVEIFGRSAGHGLAFLVAAGVVHDHPTDLSVFLVKQQVSPTQLGQFLGEDFSLAQTLRLAFIHAADLTGFGVVGSLVKSFQHIRPPPDLGKVDRLTSAIAHVWWRTHDFEEWDEQASGVQDEEGLDWTMFTEDWGGNGDITLQLNEEMTGMRLRQQLRSVEGLRRLMFSTMMLHWNLHRTSRGVALPGVVTPRRLSLNGWLDMNLGIEADGSNVPVQVQRGIYHAVSQHEAPELLPSAGADGAPAAAGDPPSLTLGAPAVPGGAPRGGLQGWASIPRGGLERYQPALFAGSQNGGPGLAQSILSEASSTLHQQAPPGGPGGTRRDGEAVWLSLQCSLLLFLSSGPDAVPYAFVRLQEAVVRDVNRQNRHLILAGRPRAPLGGKSTGKGGSAKDGGSQAATRLPFGDSARMPLPLCFLLADGRFQPFEALWLELQFQADEDLNTWAADLRFGCDGRRCSKSVVSPILSPLHAPRPSPAAPDSCAGDITVDSPRSLAPNPRRAG